MWQSAKLRPTVTEYRVGTYAFHDDPRSTKRRLPRRRRTDGARHRRQPPGEGSRDSRRRVESAHLRPGAGRGFRPRAGGAALHGGEAQRGARMGGARRRRRAAARAARADRPEPRVCGGEPVRRAPGGSERAWRRPGSSPPAAARSERQPLLVSYLLEMARWNVIERRLSAFSVSPSARNAAAVIVVATALVVVGGGVLIGCSTTRNIRTSGSGCGGPCRRSRPSGTATSRPRMSAASSSARW